MRAIESVEFPGSLVLIPARVIRFRIGRPRIDEVRPSRTPDEIGRQAAILQIFREANELRYAGRR